MPSPLRLQRYGAACILAYDRHVLTCSEKQFHIVTKFGHSGEYYPVASTFTFVIDFPPPPSLSPSSSPQLTHALIVGFVCLCAYPSTSDLGSL
jgi:hypothetical protein